MDNQSYGLRLLQLRQGGQSFVAPAKSMSLQHTSAAMIGSGSSTLASLQHLHPMQTIDGQKVIVLTPLGFGEGKPIRSLKQQPQKNTFYQWDQQEQQQQKPAHQVPSNQLFSVNQNTQYPNKKTLSSNPRRTMSSGPGSPIRRLDPAFSTTAQGWIFAIAVSFSVVAGGILAKRALDRWDEYEQLSTEDTLAYDIAYTSTYESDYDSFGSLEAESDWNGDYLDRFDI